MSNRRRAGALVLVAAVALLTLPRATLAQYGTWIRIAGAQLLRVTTTTDAVVIRQDGTGRALCLQNAAGTCVWSFTPGTGTATFPAGSGTATGGAPVVIFSSSTPASNVSTGETDLITYTMPGSTLGVNGNKLRITAYGTLANTANNKTVKVYFGASVQTVANTTAALAGWSTQMLVTRTGATTQDFFRQFNQSSTSMSNPILNAATETLSGNIIIKVTGQSAVASADITANFLMVEYLP